MHWLETKVRNIVQYLKRHLHSDTLQHAIPKVVHFIWLGSSLPEKYQHNIQTWIQHNPDYAFNLWIDSAAIDINSVKMSLIDMNKFCRKNNIHLRDIATMVEFSEFVTLPWYNDWLHGEDRTLAFAADTLRIEILLRYGGVYSDTDMLCKQQLPVWKSEHGFIGWKLSDRCPQEMFDDNCFIAAVAGHPILVACKEEIALHYQKFIICGADHIDVSRGIDVVHTMILPERLAQLKDRIAQRAVMNAAYDNYRLSDKSTIHYKTRFLSAVVSINTIKAKFKELYGHDTINNSVFKPEGILEHQRHNSWVPNSDRAQLKGILGVTHQGGLAHIDCDECLTFDEIKEKIATVPEFTRQISLMGRLACKY